MKKRAHSRSLGGSSSMDKEYNGWSNYPTWDVHLWLTNDEGSYNYWRDVAREVHTSKSDRKSAVFKLSEIMQETIEEMADEALKSQFSASMFSDILGWVLNKVDWEEIAEHFVDEEI